MDILKACRLSCYRKISDLNIEHGVELVQHTETEKLYVKKILTVYNANVFRYLKEKPVRHMPVIEELFEDDGFLTVIEEYIPGENLQAYLDRGKRFEEAEAIRIVREVCLILNELHCAVPPVIHRDVKPSNVILSPDGTVTLIDMNAAKFADRGETQDTMLIGTAGYAAPEQYGFAASDARTDIYAAGVLLNMLISGYPPRERKISGAAGKIVEQCTKMDPGDRYRDMEELILSIDEACVRAARQKHPNALPGFRTMKCWKMVLAAAGYISLIGICASMGSGSFSPVSAMINRLFVFLTGLSEVFFLFNYRDIWKKLKISGIRNGCLKAIAVFSGAILILLIAVLIMPVIVFVEAFFEP